MFRKFIFEVEIPVEYFDDIYLTHPPRYETDGAVGFDLRACFDESELTVMPGDTFRIPSGLGLVLPKYHAGLMIVRSGMSTHGGLRIVNQTGVIDSDYRGQMSICVGATKPEGCKIVRHERIAQLLIVPTVRARFLPTKDIANQYPTHRGGNGFGHTGLR
jgi:dUTP pyrophosphatase